MGVKYETIKKSAQRAGKSGKKFCSINGQNCLLNMLDGNIGGASGKTLQIWIDDILWTVAAVASAAAIAVICFAERKLAKK